MFKKELLEEELKTRIGKIDISISLLGEKSLIDSSVEGAVTLREYKAQKRVLVQLKRMVEDGQFEE